MAIEPSRGDTVVVLLKKILLALGCPGVDCCGYQTEQMLLYLWAKCLYENSLNPPIPPIPPVPPPESFLWLLENNDFFQLEDGSGGFLLE